ncbi:MAG: TRAP transporter substrate-binding protein, partial [Myxococcales bacterium]|nr:TRAP transporter substrate-binding protein [Myxococcales bacterium]
MIRCIVALFAVAALAGPALAGDDGEVNMKLATVAPKGTPWSDLLERYKAAVDEKSGGKIKVRAFLGGVKGDEQSIARQVYKGSLQMGGVSTGAMAAIVPDMDILELPYLFDDFAQADAILDQVRPIVEKLLEEKGFKLIMYSENGYRSFGLKGFEGDDTKERFIHSPADLKAVKMRSQESPVHVAMYRALGASPVTIAVGEVLSSLQTGVCEGMDNTPLFIQAVSWHQAIKYYTVSEHIYQPALLVVNKAWFDGLDPEVQKAIVEPALGLEKKGRKAVRALEPLLLKNLEKGGTKVYELTEAERDAFR